MANEVTFGYPISRTLTYVVYQPDGTERTASQGIAETDVGVSGYYVDDNASITNGDIVIVKEGTVVVGHGEYQPEVDCVLIEGDDFTETLIGADSDTLETISDQLDTVSQQAATVFNTYGAGE